MSKKIREVSREIYQAELKDQEEKWERAYEYKY
jgi:hypothetical protein